MAFERIGTRVNICDPLLEGLFSVTKEFQAPVKNVYMLVKGRYARLIDFQAAFHPLLISPPASQSASQSPSQPASHQRSQPATSKQQVNWWGPVAVGVALWDLGILTHTTGANNASPKPWGR